MTALPRRAVTTALGIALVGAAMAFGIGFAWFVHRVEMPGEAPPHTDGIVAFTGGAERVETALRLLAEGHADRLLLSGIGGGAELTELARRAGVDPRPLATRVTIDRSAATTRGNAAGTAAWARDNQVRSLLVVTAAYHMPRAMTELARALPEVALYPLPVVLPDRPNHNAVPLRLVAEEYLKFLATTAGFSAVLPMHEVPPAHAGRAG
jgi:uncharacterized SAM-binding protein YcdF (DUF218 family)